MPTPFPELHMRRSRALLVAIALSACKATTDAPKPTTLLVTPTTVTFTALGQTQLLAVVVKDQNGTAMTGFTPTFTSSASATASVSAAGLVTGSAVGTATIAVAAAGLTTNVPVTVGQMPAQLVKQFGDAQAGPVGAVLGSALSVRVNDALGSPVPGVGVTFAVTAGGGSVGSPSATTNASGVATSTWTLGTIASQAQGVSAGATGLASVSFTATATAGVAAAVVIQAGNNQTGTVGAPLPVLPSVRVNDAFGNAKANVTVQFTVTGGGGSIASPTQITTAAGIATAGAWTLGAGVGANALTASVVGTAVNAIFNATGQAAGAPVNMVAFVGDNQTALIGYASNIRPAVRVTDAGNGPVSGVSVTFAVTAGGGSVTGATVSTNAQGIAQVGSWVVGGAAGANTLDATAATLPTVTFTATGQTQQYNIEVRNIGPAFSPDVQAAFDSAKARWERAIYGDLTDIPLSNQTNVCGLGITLNETVDDMLILARFDSIDGPGQVLGSAGDCGLVRSSNGLAIIGQMRFDTADVAGLIAAGSLRDVILHEMGHVLGFSGGRFDLTITGFSRDCIDLQTSGTPPNVVSQDTHFKCPMGRAMFDSIGGTSYTGGIKVPLENCAVGVPSSCGGGTYNGHWRESTFFNELMTGYLNGGTLNPMSVLTIAVYEDLGYLVNYAAASPYARVFTAPAAFAGSVIDLGNDVMVSRLITVIDDRTGRVVRVIRQ